MPQGRSPADVPPLRGSGWPTTDGDAPAPAAASSEPPAATSDEAALRQTGAIAQRCYEQAVGMSLAEGASGKLVLRVHLDSEGTVTRKEVVDAATEKSVSDSRFLACVLDGVARVRFAAKPHADERVLDVPLVVSASE